ncbi:MAG TPA: DUF2723 domain-containing protein, partial [Anaerolineae bacterium]|nr:DUF2723 domain-containing protein [Anaerolineae bacterium]
GRPSNAPGYPLYTMGGWLWFHGLRSVLRDAANPTSILSAYSTLWALLALGLLYILILDLTDNWVIAFLLGAFYAVSYFFWYYAVSTEQYTSAVAQTLAIVLLALRWEAAQDRVDQAGDPTARADGILLALALLSGLALAHMVTVAVIVPPLLWFILSRRPGLLHRGRLVAAAIGLALLPLLSYAFIYVRGAQHPEWRGAGQWPNTAAWFLDFVSTSQGRDELTWSLQPLWTHDFPSMVWHELTWVVLLGGLAGLTLLGRRRGLFLGATLLLYALLAFIDRQGNWFQVIMPAYPLLLASFATVVQALWRRVAGSGRPASQRRALLALLVAGLLALVVVRFERSWPDANLRDRQDDTALLSGQAILADVPEPNAAVFGVTSEALSLRYLTDIWGQRPDVTAVSSLEAQALLAGASRPLYVTVDAAPLVWLEIDPAAHLSSAGQTLIRVTQDPVTTLPSDTSLLNISTGAGLSLSGIVAPQPAPGQPWPVRLVWRADDAIAYDWSVSVRPTEGGQPLAHPEGGIVQQDLAHPVHGAYPTSRWLSGEVVADDYLFMLPPGSIPDGVQVVIYRVLPDGGFENLAQLDVPLR